MLISIGIENHNYIDIDDIYDYHNYHNIPSKSSMIIVSYYIMSLSLITNNYPS